MTSKSDQEFVERVAKWRISDCVSRSTFKQGDLEISYNHNNDTKEAIFEKLLAWYKEHKCYDGEAITQNDDCQVYAVDILAELADDVFKFEMR